MLGGEFNKEKDLTVDKIKMYWGMMTDNTVKKTLLFLAPILVAFLMVWMSKGSIVVASCTFLVSIWFLLIAMWILVWILKMDCGEENMIEVSDSIKEGSEGYFYQQYGVIFKMAIVSSFGILALYMFRSPTNNSLLTEHVSHYLMALFVWTSFLLGAFCSALSGYAGLWVSVRANIRVAAASKKCYDTAMKICFRGGAFAAIINVALALAGISAQYLLVYLFFWVHIPSDKEVPIEEIPVLLVGYGFGASFVAMFAQLGGGIYTKAADVGADLIGKVEQGIPEDDPRNPAVIADLVGDNVGDCAGQCADLFESISAEIISAMILGGTLAQDSGLSAQSKAGFILFPLLIHLLDLASSTISVFFVKSTKGIPLRNLNGESIEDPMVVLKRAYYVSILLSSGGAFVICRLFLNIQEIEGAYWNFFLCALVGISVNFLILNITQYYTDYNYGPVKHIAQSSKMGHATNIISGLSVGLESTGLPVIVISIAVLSSFYLGQAAGLEGKNGELIGGLYGTAIATMGMFSNGVYVLSMSGFGPIADNAGGIVEMSQQEDFVRDITDRLDAVGNVTKANTKGYSVGSASLACFLLFSAFIDEVQIYTGEQIPSIDITVPEIFIGGLLGAVTVFVFSSWSIKAVGNAAEDVIVEVRRQFRDNPAIMTYDQKPDYKGCVSMVAAAGQREMIKPGLLAVGMPIIVGVIFRGIGKLKGEPILGAEALASYLMFSTATGILMANFFNNGGGAWDNAKKLVETGEYGGKGSETHKAAVTGDTVGDPFKDTAGPSIHILIKLVATITLVLTPLFV